MIAKKFLMINAKQEAVLWEEGKQYFEDFAAKRRGAYLKNYVRLPIKLHLEIITETLSLCGAFHASKVTESKTHSHDYYKDKRF